MVLVGPRVTVSALVVVVVQVSWRTWGIFCNERRDRPKLAISSSTDNRNTQRMLSPRLIVWVWYTLPRPMVVAISVVGLTRIRAAAARVAISAAVAPTLARRGVMPALVHGSSRKQNKAKKEYPEGEKSKSPEITIIRPLGRSWQPQAVQPLATEATSKARDVNQLTAETRCKLTRAKGDQSTSIAGRVFAGALPIRESQCDLDLITVLNRRGHCCCGSWSMTGSLEHHLQLRTVVDGRDRRSELL